MKAAVMSITVGQLTETSQARPAKHKREALFKHIPRLVVYVVRDMSRVIYIGMTSVGPRERLSGHKGGNSALGLAIKRNIPSSNGWLVDLYSMPNRRAAYGVERILEKTFQPEIRE